MSLLENGTNISRLQLLVIEFQRERNFKAQRAEDSKSISDKIGARTENTEQLVILHSAMKRDDPSHDEASQ